MAKSKNHTNHNQSYKAHRNGIYKVKEGVKLNSKGQNQKMLRNTRYAKKFDPSVKKPKNFAKKIERLRALGKSAYAPVKKVAPVKVQQPIKKDAPKKK